MRATLWQGTGETSRLRRIILREVFAEAGIHLDVVSSQEELLAAAGRSRRTRDHDFLIIDCSGGEPSDVERCVAVAARTRLALHIIHPHQEIFQAIERAARRPLVWVPAGLTVDVLLALLHALKAEAAAVEAAEWERPALTPREREVLEQVVAGHSSREIATELAMSEHTVKSHVRAIMHKFGVASRAQLAAAYRPVGVSG